jgi:hypothetical protein
MNWKGRGTKKIVAYFKCCRGTHVGRLKKITRNLIGQDSRSSSSSSSLSSSSSSVCHGVGPLVDPFLSHASRSLFKGLPRFLLPDGE